MPLMLVGKLMRFTKRRLLLLVGVVILVTGFIVPQTFTMPVDGAGRRDYSPASFWYYPWGKSVTHKGVDIFAQEGATVRSATSGLVLFSGNIEMGGNVVLVAGPKWRLHYYAHLLDAHVSVFSLVASGSEIGTVGTSGNAAGKPPHLHYSLITVFPYVWRMDQSKQGWKKMFYLNPIDYLNDVCR